MKYYCVFCINKFFFVYKMFNITKETLENNGIEVIVDSAHALWLNEKNIEEKLAHKNLPVISNKYNKIYKKSKKRFIKEQEVKVLLSNLGIKISLSKIPLLNVFFECVCV